MQLTRRRMMTGLASLPLVPVAAALMAPAQAQAQAQAQTQPRAFPVPERLPLERGDYAQARHHFRTHLLHAGPSPEPSPPLGTPPGATRVTYRGGPAGSIELVAWLSQYDPTGAPKPAVLFLHGGNATGEGHWALMKGYHDAGFVVLHPSFRGENGQAGNYSGFYDETSDALSAARDLENLPGIDRDRVFLAGHSNGGTLALLAAMSRPFRAAAPISAGVNSWRYFNRYGDEIRFDAQDPNEFIMRSSVCFGPSLKCPTLLLRGAQERPFDADHELLVERVRSVGTAIDKKILPGDHTGVVPGAVEESIRFFNQFA